MQINLRFLIVVAMWTAGCTAGNPHYTCNCPATPIADPVCASDGTTYPGACEAGCAGAQVRHDGACGPGDGGCSCSIVVNSVCGQDGHTYGNACLAHCASVVVAHVNACGTSNGGEGRLTFSSDRYLQDGATMSHASAAAGFYTPHAPEPPVGYTCERSSQDGCTLEECNQYPVDCVQGQDCRAQEAVANAGAGAVSFSAGTRSFSFFGEPNLAAYKPLSASTFWQGGETLTVTATGAAVPAFSAQLVTPTVAKLSAPALATGTVNLTLTRTADAPVRWSGASAGDLVLTIVTALPGSWSPSSRLTITCTYPAAQGLGTIPARVLEGFAGHFPEPVSAQLDARVRVTQTVTQGGWSHSLEASSAATTTDGLTYSGTVQVQ
jgi:hypothetical protein